MCGQEGPQGPENVKTRAKAEAQRGAEDEAQALETDRHRIRFTGKARSQGDSLLPLHSG